MAYELPFVPARGESNISNDTKGWLCTGVMNDGSLKVFLPIIASVAGYSGAQWEHHPGQEQLPTRGNTMGPQVEIILEALQV